VLRSRPHCMGWSICGAVRLAEGAGAMYNTKVGGQGGARPAQTWGIEWRTLRLRLRCRWRQGRNDHLPPCGHSRRMIPACAALRPGPTAVLTLALMTSCVLTAGCGVGTNANSPPPAPPPTIAPGSNADLQAVSAAIGRSMSMSAQVELALSANQVFGAATASVAGSGAFDFEKAQGQAQLQQPTGIETVVFLPASVFVRQPTGPNVLPKGRIWVSAGLTESALTTNFPQFVIQAEALNPVFLLDEAAWGATAAAPLGAASVNGSTSHGYLVAVDLVRAASSAHGPAALAFTKAIGFQLAYLGGGSSVSGATTVSLRLWVDDATGRIVRMQASPPGAGAGTVNVTLYDFGTTVRVVAPPRAKVADIASLSPGGERENNGGGDSDGA